MSTKYILRIDDVSPGMSWSNFLPFKLFLESYNIKSVLGVVPDCQDRKLNIEHEKKDFFDYIRAYHQYGDSIAQHGFSHVYDSKSPGVLRINNRSEFAGHVYSEQFWRIKKGKDILIKEGVWQPWFMPPAHSFDYLTLRVLSDLGFKAVTDGYGFYPYKIGSMLLVPQMTSYPMNTGFGVMTICLHLNSMSDNQVDNVKKFIEVNHRSMLDFKDVVASGDVSNGMATISRILSMLTLRSYRMVRQLRMYFIQ